MWLQAALILVFMLFAAAIGFAMAWLWLGETHRKQQQSANDNTKRLQDSEKQRQQLHAALEKAKQSMLSANQLLRDERRKTQKAEQELETSNKRYWDQFEQGNPAELQAEAQKLKQQNAKLMREMRHLQQRLTQQQAVAQPSHAPSTQVQRFATPSNHYEHNYEPAYEPPLAQTLLEEPIELDAEAHFCLDAPAQYPSHTPMHSPVHSATVRQHSHAPPSTHPAQARPNAHQPPALAQQTLSSNPAMNAWASSEDETSDDEELALFQSMIEPLDPISADELDEPSGQPPSAEPHHRESAPLALNEPPHPHAHPSAAQPAQGTQPVASKARASATRSTRRDDLKQIKGIGPGIESVLNGVGIYRYEQLAQITQSDLKQISEAMRQIPGHRFQKEWVQGARELLSPSKTPKAHHE